MTNFNSDGLGSCLSSHIDTSGDQVFDRTCASEPRNGFAGASTLGFIRRGQRRDFLDIGVTTNVRGTSVIVVASLLAGCQKL